MNHAAGRGVPHSPHADFHGHGDFMQLCRASLLRRAAGLMHAAGPTARPLSVIQCQSGGSYADRSCGEDAEQRDPPYMMVGTVSRVRPATNLASRDSCIVTSPMFVAPYRADHFSRRNSSTALRHASGR